MKPIQILMPMGGLGQRFRSEGYDTPKPLIDVKGRPMFLEALSSFDAYGGDKRHLFVVRQDAQNEYQLSSKIRSLLPDSKIAILHDNTRGAVETCLLAREWIDPQLPLIVMDCDFSFTAADYFSKITDLARKGAYDGVLLSFDSDWDRYSYALTNEGGLVMEVAEKKAISRNALAGAYCFGSGEMFVSAADKLMEYPLGKNMKEYYISLLYNLLINDGKKIALVKADTFHSFGTPEELAVFLGK